ncbi:MAG: hypothetical protein C4541_08495 [Candidatus Auribacter fodinae]|jgi:hypothetical protein|uniref:Uncharacterized protein n=1 Tax=Candidatus Auribacter fodinae TaxID=2093366 RepID=A0A3A4QWA6_9BACT|nr:MAG: hypothetical protein C4541_08495 [Candidatus Auribacter fodinae]
MKNSCVSLLRCGGFLIALNRNFTMIKIALPLILGALFEKNGCSFSIIRRNKYSSNAIYRNKNYGRVNVLQNNADNLLYKYEISLFTYVVIKNLQSI